MLKYTILFAACICAAVYARPQEITVVASENTNDGSGNFKSLSELSDGTRVEQSGSIKNPEAPPEEQIQVLQGSFSFVDPASGQTFSVVYTADENGFQPQGDHLPTAPPARK